MKKLVLLSTTLLPIISFAHGGHGILPDGLAHYLFSAQHLFYGIALLAVGIYFVVRKKKDHA